MCHASSETRFIRTQEDMKWLVLAVVIAAVTAEFNEVCNYELNLQNNMPS